MKQPWLVWLPLLVAAVVHARPAPRAAKLAGQPGGEEGVNRDPLRTAEALHRRMAELAAGSGGAARLVTIVTSPQGRALEALEVDLDRQFDGTKRVLLVHGGMHGNEWLATEVALHLAELTLAARPAELRALEVHFIPATNIDGFARGRRVAVRADGSPLDPNRDFAVPFTPDGPSSPVVQGFKDYASRGRLAGVLDYHTFGDCVMWPWAFTRERQPENIAALQQVAEEMARTIGYCHGQVGRIIGYKHQGTAQDWFFHFLKVPALLIEMGDRIDPFPGSLQQVLIDHERPFLVFARWLSSINRDVRP